VPRPNCPRSGGRPNKSLNRRTAAAGNGRAGLRFCPPTQKSVGAGKARSAGPPACAFVSPVAGVSTNPEGLSQTVKQALNPLPSSRGRGRGQQRTQPARAARFMAVKPITREGMRGGSCPRRPRRLGVPGRRSSWRTSAARPTDAGLPSAAGPATVKRATFLVSTVGRLCAGSFSRWPRMSKPMCASPGGILIVQFKQPDLARAGHALAGPSGSLAPTASVGRRCHRERSRAA